MAQRHVEALIGRLITDDQLRDAFLKDAEATLVALCHRGLDLSAVERAALIATSQDLWRLAAELLDPRLQKASLERNSQVQETKHHG